MADLDTCIPSSPNYQNYQGWKDIFDCTDPNSWFAVGIFVCMGFSILGAGM